MIWRRISLRQSQQKNDTKGGRTKPLRGIGALGLPCAQPITQFIL